MVKVLVVDDEQMLVDLLRRQLQAEGYDVLAAADGVSALRLARRHRPHLVILDIAMPGIDGLEVCRQLRADKTLADVLILFLTSRAETSDRVNGLDLGGDDYLAKPFDAAELLARVRALLRRTSSVSRIDSTDAGILRVGRLELDPARCVARIAGDEFELPPVQFDLLHHFMTHPDEVFAADELLRKVWGYPPGTGDTSLVRWHIRTLRKRLEPDPEAPRYLCTVPRQGYILRSVDS